MCDLSWCYLTVGGDNQASQKMAETEKEIKSIDKRMADLGFGMLHCHFISFIFFSYLA